MFEGMPVKIVPVMIIFLNFEAKTGVQRREGFPSWSWAGWKGSPLWDLLNRFDFIFNAVELDKWLDSKTWIVWHRLTSESSTEMICQPSSSQSATSNTTRNDLYRSLHMPIDVGLPDMKLAFEGLPKLKSITYTVLFLQTTVISLRLGTTELMKPDNHQTMNSSPKRHTLEDITGSICGCFYPDVELPVSDGNQYEFMLLCGCHDLSDPLEGGVPLERRKESLYSLNDDMPCSLNDAALHVMHIISVGEVHERRGIGHVARAAIDNSFSPGPRWKTIFLG